MRVEKKLETGGAISVDATGAYLEVSVARGDLSCFLSLVETEWLIMMLQRGNAIVRTRLINHPPAPASERP